MNVFEDTNGYIANMGNGEHGGKLCIDGVDLSPIEGVYFKKDSDKYLWIKRRPILEYDGETMSFKKRKREPRFEAYLKKVVKDNVTMYEGDCVLFRFKYRIVGLWDKFDGKEKQRMNLFVERLPLSEQTIIQSFNKKTKGNEQD